MFTRGIIEELLFFLRGDTDTSYLEKKKISKANLWAMKAKKLDKSDPLAIKAGIDVMIVKKQYTKALRLLQDGLKKQPQSCDLLMSFVKVNHAKGYEKLVVSNSKFVIKLCPDLAEPHFYLGMIAHKFFDKKEAKKQFKIFKKMGGNKSMLPKGY